MKVVVIFGFFFPCEKRCRANSVGRYGMPGMELALESPGRSLPLSQVSHQASGFVVLVEGPGTCGPWPGTLDMIKADGSLE
jgi:hypothetical protein